MNKVIFGLENVHVAFKDTVGWKPPVAIPGAVRFAPEAQGEESTFYADNGPYFSVTANNGYTAELEIALLPDLILVEMLGWEIDANGMVVEVADGIQKEFALMGQVQGDSKNRRFVYYSCKASRPSKEDKTQEGSVEPSTETLNIVITPIEVNGKNIVKGTLELNETNAAAYNAFFSQVVVPGAVIGAVVKTELASVIALAGKLNQADYTPESWTTFQGVLTSSTAVNTNAASTQYEVNKATAALQNAILELVAVA